MTFHVSHLGEKEELRSETEEKLIDTLTRLKLDFNDFKQIVETVSERIWVKHTLIKSREGE